MISNPPATISSTRTPSMRAFGARVRAARRDVPEGGAHGFRGIEAQLYSPDVGLVEDVRRGDLEGDRVPDLGGKERGLVRVAGEAAAWQDEAVLGKRGHAHNARGDEGLCTNRSLVLFGDDKYNVRKPTKT